MAAQLIRSTRGTLVPHPSPLASTCCIRAHCSLFALKGPWCGRVLTEGLTPSWVCSSILEGINKDESAYGLVRKEKDEKIRKHKDVSDDGLTTGRHLMVGQVLSTNQLVAGLDGE